MSEKFIEGSLMQSLVTKEGRKVAIEKGLNFISIDSIIKNQVDLCPYGVADMVQIEFFKSKSHGGVLIFHVIELKATELKVAHIAQLSRYIRGLESHLSKHEDFKGFKIGVQGVLLTLDNRNNRGDEVFLIDKVNNIDWYEYTFDIRGFNFFLQEKGWVRNEGIFKKSNYEIFGKLEMQRVLNFKNEILKAKKI